MKKTALLVSIAICVSLLSCMYEKGEEAKPDPTIHCDTNRIITFSGDIAPFLSSTCGSADINCHSSSASSMIPLDVYVGAQYYGQNGQLMNSVNWTGGASTMPKNSAKLSNCDRAMLQKWVNEGEPNN